MIKSVSFLSRANFESKYKVSPQMKSVAISIVDPVGPNSTLARPPRGLHGILRLSFEDECEESIGVEVGSIPDLHVMHEDGVRLFLQGNELCDASDAVKINRFLAHYHCSSEDVQLIVHCQAGISRSAAVARFASEEFACAIHQDCGDTSGANRRLLRLLRSAADGQRPSMGTITPCVENGDSVLVELDGTEYVVLIEAPSTRKLMMSI